MIAKLKNIKLNSAGKSDVYVFTFESKYMPEELLNLQKFDKVSIKAEGLQKSIQVDNQTGEVFGDFSSVDFQSSDIKLSINYGEESLSGNLQIGCYEKHVAAKFLEANLRGRDLELSFK